MAAQKKVARVITLELDLRGPLVRLAVQDAAEAYLTRKVLGLAGGSPRPGGQIVAKMSRRQLRAVAERKLPDLNTDDVDAAMRQVAGTARSMGVLIEDD